jgi:hypothetical protein
VLKGKVTQIFFFQNPVEPTYRNHVQEDFFVFYKKKNQNFHFEVLNLTDLSSKLLMEPGWRRINPASCSRGGAGSIQLHQMGWRRINPASCSRGGAGFAENLCKSGFMQAGGRRIRLYGHAAMADCSQSAGSVGDEHSDTNTIGPWCVTEVVKRECLL